MSEVGSHLAELYYPGRFADIPDSVLEMAAEALELDHLTLRYAIDGPVLGDRLRMEQSWHLYCYPLVPLDSVTGRRPPYVPPIVDGWEVTYYPVLQFRYRGPVMRAVFMDGGNGNRWIALAQ